MPRDPLMPLRDISNCIGRCVRFAQGCTQEQLEEDEMRLAALERQLTIIGEAMVRLRDHHPEVFSRIGDGHRIIGLRNRLMHQYDEVENAKLVDVVADNLPVLQEEINRLFVEISDD